jgi:hypothetical protein
MFKLRNPKKLGIIIALAILSLLAIFGAAFWKANNIAFEGDKNTQWLRADMWPAQYFNKGAVALGDTEAVYIKSLDFSDAEKHGITDYLHSNKCTDSSEKCLTLLLSVVNILVRERNFEEAKKLENQAAKGFYEQGFCPIKFEITLLNHVIQTIKLENFLKSRSKAQSTIEIIKQGKGINFNMQTPACNQLAEVSPALFHRYVMLVADLMSYAGGTYAEHATYLRFIEKTQLKKEL